MIERRKSRPRDGDLLHVLQFRAHSPDRVYRSGELPSPFEQLVRVHVKAAHLAQHRPPYAVYDDRFEVDQASGSAWTKAGVDTLQAGVEVVA